MKIISHKKSELDKFREKISNYVETYESMGFEYWVFLVESNPIAIFFLGKEPVNLIEPPGTVVSMIEIIDYDKAYDNIKDITTKAINMGKEKSVKYVFVSSLPEEQIEIVRALKQQGFKEKSRWYRMERSLDNIDTPQGILRLDKIEREKVKEFLDVADKCTSGSYEGESILNLVGVPGGLLTFWYNMQELYYVYKENEIIGILNLTPNSQSNLNNIGVSPQYRSKGYGKQILLYALERLKNLGKEKVGLRVHVDNNRAIGLYKSFGFKITNQTIDLIHWEDISH